MPAKSKQFYEFATFRLDPSEKVLLNQGKPVPLTPKVFDTLEILVENTGKLLEKDELMQRLWQDHFVEESNLTSNIKMLRKALGDDAARPEFIETVPRRGYRFIAEVKEISNANGTNSTTRFKSLLVAMIIILVAGVGSLGYWLTRNATAEAPAPILSAPFASQKLSTNGKVLRAAISRDGKSVVYTNEIEGRQSVWLRQLETANNVEIIPASDDLYFGLALSPDGNFLYFTRKPKSFEGQADLYRVSIFGGIPSKIVAETQGSTNISADGRKLSFVRCYYRDDEYCSLWIADASDGKNEKKLAARPRPIRIGDNEISPDGKSVVFAVGQSQNQANEFGLVEVDVETGAERELTTERFFNIRSLAWLPDKSGLLFTASRVPNKHFRIWQVTFASGEVSPVTNDSESYSALSLDRDANRLVSTQGKQDFRLHLIDLEKPSTDRVLADASSVAFAPDGKIVFSSPMSGNDEIWRIDADGSRQRQLTNNSADEYVEMVSPDGSSIFFSSNRTGQIHIWRMNADGSDQTQLTQKEGGNPLFVSADGRWLYYHHALDRTVWRVSTTPSHEEQLVLEKRKDRFAFSPDGSRIAFLEKEGEEDHLKVISLPDGQTVKTYTLADETANLVQLKWSPNGENLAYILAGRENENKTLWFQPLNGSTPRQIASFGDEQIALFGFELSPDGRQAAIVKGGWRYDAVLITGLR